MTIKLNEFDKKLLSQITPASKWDKLKSIYAINSVVKQLKIGNKKIGTKCAKHLQKISKQNTTSIQEIREGCRDLKIPKQKLPLAKDTTKREVESVHKINKATDKPPTDKTKSGGGGKGGGGGKPQPEADLVTGLFSAFKAQEAKQARDAQFNLLSREMNRDINLDLARTEQRARQEAGLGRAFGSQDTTLQALKTALLTQREAKQLGERNVPSLTSAENRVLDALLKDERPNPEDLLKANPEQDLSGFSDISSMSSLSGISALMSPLELRTQQLSNVKMFNPTQEEKNKLAMDLLEAREQNLSSVQASVKRKQEMLKEKVAEADIYAEQQRQSMIKNKIGLQTENYINKQREEIKSNVLNNNMDHKEAQKKLQQLNTFYLKQLEYDQQQRVNKNIFNDIEEIERDRQFRLRNRKVGVDSVLSRLRNRESQEQQDRLVNDLIINQNEKRIQDIQSELLGSVSNRLEANERQQLQTTQNLKNEIMGNIKQRGKKMQNVDEKFILEKQELQKTINTIEEQQEQERADRAMREFISRQNLSEFNQQSQPLGLTRTSSLSLLERMEADSLRQAQENQELQRTLSAGGTPSQELDVERAKRKIKEQQESEALFNRKQQELAQQIQNLEAQDFARPIEKKESPREMPFEERKAKWRLRNLGYDILERDAASRDDETRFSQFFNANMRMPGYRDEREYLTPSFIEKTFEDFKKGVPLGEKPISENQKKHIEEMALLEPVWNKINDDIQLKLLTNIPENDRNVDINIREIDPAKVPIELLTNEEIQEKMKSRPRWRDTIIFEEHQGLNQQNDKIYQLQEKANRYNMALMLNYTKQEREERGLKQIDFDKEYLSLIPPEKYDLWGYADSESRNHSEPLKEDDFRN